MRYQNQRKMTKGELRAEHVRKIFEIKYESFVCVCFASQRWLLFEDDGCEKTFLKGGTEVFPPEMLKRDSSKSFNVIYAKKNQLLKLQS